MVLRIGLLVLLTAGVAQANPNVATTPKLSPAEEQKQFRLPPGFEAQLVASEPDILKPMNLAWDAHGRLWVTSSIEYPWPSEKAPAKDRLQVLSDFGPDGRARKIVTFADDLNIPIGVLPLPSGNDVLVHSIPNVYLLRDTNGDGKADERKVILSGIGYRDTHGMVNSFRLGFDGWIYACHGFANESTIRGSDGRTIRLQSGNTFRFRPDGTGLESYTFGQVNPFGMTFDPFGDLFTADCHSKPITNLIPGAYYSSFGKPHDGLGFGPDMIGHDHASTGLCGLTYNTGDHFPEAFRDTMFLGNVVTSRINQDRIVRNGSSPQAQEQPDFLRSDDPWFRPVDLQIGPDGALYVADFYNRIIGHYEVPLTHPGRDRDSGRIWRIRYVGNDTRPTPMATPAAHFATGPVDAVVQDLGHPNQSVRMLAMNALVHRGESVLPAVEAALAKPRNEWQQIQAMWVRERLKPLDDAALTPLVDSPSAAIRTHAMRLLANRATLSPAQRNWITKGVQDSNPRVARSAAFAIDRVGDWSQSDAVLQRFLTVPGNDPHLKHALKIALRSLANRASESFASIGTQPLPPVQQGAWAEVALGVHRPEAATVLSRLLASLESIGGRDLFLRGTQHLARYGDADPIDSLVTYLQTPAVTGDTGRLIGALQAIQRGSQERGRGMPEVVRSLAAKIATESLNSPDLARQQAGLELANAVRIDSAFPQIAAIATDRNRSEAQRLAALPVMANLGGRNAVDRLAALVTQANEPLPIRERAAQALASINDATASNALAAAIGTAPARLATTIALSLADSPTGGTALLTTIQAGKASGRLLQDRAVAQKLKERKLPNLEVRIAELTRGLPSADERMLERMNQRRQGFQTASKDLQLGKSLFAKNCAICHQLGGEGAKIGPQLDGIGARGLERLLEDVLDPSRNVDQALRTTSFELSDGRLVSGLVLREIGEVVVIADAQGKEVTLPKDRIESRTTSLLSPMPANVSEQLTEPEFYHLLAYLLEQKPKEPTPAKP
ncbi:PVC-type heme-binding CxxCH protein [Tuwongella immobilis]|uniref:Cytochrome c domain-containing protein n=1 Tax=Tuwongella immobilis TaxID=692036 RepID=A0A6C2YUU7_9BACT|nr:PVC-type heme-binding CxxCH protein [Tuwongella immobilis]VIP05390.1 membrane-bound dehydrogenase domain protein : Putative membrane-bound dehydrogenase OS=Singulisphaera acidiphila (strain ATCC BAA-1392 / DSM 18658 / VKM B-2454 / MOB10) GN=Sinac_5028 PE=4 SV=1: Cytochrom_C [Tuwongella immobilis]VTS08136.1 membrane-bound dehydrogenase domain protein : Putative membrane-bound dehydrogenase OS=Singulisphaera acidiphila (strain ATCC BAA-1392 / DSM 18658 / VKM B-2454 / MOB10) GN=Sinac_5028 PE=4 SV